MDSNRRTAANRHWLTAEQNMSYDIYLVKPRNGESVEDAYDHAVEGEGVLRPDTN